MDITLGNIQLMRTDAAHAGNTPLVDTSKKLYFGQNGTISNSEAPAKKHSTFEGYLLDAMTELNGQQNAVGALQEKVITDPDSVDIHDVTIAMAKAQMSLNLAQTVIDRVISGWNELSQNR